MKLLTDFVKIILVVLGFVSYYPEVKVENVFVYKDFKDSEKVRTQIKFKDLLNPSFIEMIKSGNRIELIFFIATYDGKKLVYQDKVIKSVSYENNLFFVDGLKLKNEKLLIDWISVVDFVILTGKSKYISKMLDTHIDLKCSSDLNVELASLWGNKPRIIITYKIER